MKKSADRRTETELYVKVTPLPPLFAFWGVVCNASERGLLIRSTGSLPSGTVVDMEVFMPGIDPCLLKGTVRRVAKLSEPDERFGIGVELTGRSLEYDRLLKFVDCHVHITYATSMQDVLC